MTRRTKWIVGGVVALAIIAALAGAAAAKRAPKGTRVRTTTVARGDLVSLVTANGTLEAETKVDLSANIMGQIMQLNVEEGDRVRKGDLLLVIDQTRYGAAVDSRQAALQVLEAQLTRTREVAQQAARDRERAQRQYEQQILPLASYEQARSMSDQAQAGLSAAERQINQARADLKAAQDELAKTEIRAPMDGVVTRRNIETGEVVVTGTMNNPGTVLMTISDMASIEAVLEVDQTDMPRVRLGQPTKVLIDAFRPAPPPACPRSAAATSRALAWAGGPRARTTR
jgi:HlyD family secretion protein